VPSSGTLVPLDARPSVALEGPLERAGVLWRVHQSVYAIRHRPDGGFGVRV